MLLFLPAVSAALPTPPPEFHAASMRVQSVQANLDIRMSWWRSAAAVAERHLFFNVSTLNPPGPQPGTTCFAVDTFVLPSIQYNVYDKQASLPPFRKPACCSLPHNGTLEEMYALPGDARRNGTVACGSDGASKCDVWTGIFSAMGWCYRYYIEPGTGVLRRFEEWLTPTCHGDPTQITAIDGVELPASVPSSDLEPPSNCTAAPVCGGGGAAAHGTATTRPRSAYALVAAILAAGDRTKV